MSDSNPIVRIIRHNARLKLLAVTLAIVSWFLVREETSYEQLITGLTVEVTPPAGWVVVAQTPSKVAVRFRGSRGDILTMTDDNIKIAVDMKEGSKESSSVRLSARSVRAPAGIRALRVEPSAITVQIVKK